MKSEPNDYSIDDLERDGSEPWDGIRNYQARNMIRDDMKMGDQVLFLQSLALQKLPVAPIPIRPNSIPGRTTTTRKAKKMIHAGCWSMWHSSARRNGR